MCVDGCSSDGGAGDAVDCCLPVVVIRSVVEQEMAGPRLGGALGVTAPTAVAPKVRLTCVQYCPMHQHLRWVGYITSSIGKSHGHLGVRIRVMLIID